MEPEYVPLVGIGLGIGLQITFWILYFRERRLKNKALRELRKYN